MIREYESPAGTMLIAAKDGFITGLDFKDTCKVVRPFDSKSEDAIETCVRELDAYFAGNLREFTIKTHAPGTEFRKLCWAQLQKIPYGETISYKELARRIGNPAAIRAVGGANHNNPVSIIIPCHRVIGANGSLTGYGGGLERKKFLLELEQR